MEIIRGDTKLCCFKIFDDNLKTTPHIMEEGEQLSFSVKTNVNNKTSVIEKHWGYEIIYNETLSRYEFMLNSSDTEELKIYEDYIFDVEYVSQDGIVKTLIVDTLTVTPDVTLSNNRG